MLSSKLLYVHILRDGHGVLYIIHLTAILSVLSAFYNLSAGLLTIDKIKDI